MQQKDLVDVGYRERSDNCNSPVELSNLLDTADRHLSGCIRGAILAALPLDGDVRHKFCCADLFNVKG